MAGVFNGHQFAANRSRRAAIPGWTTSVSAPPEAIRIKPDTSASGASRSRRRSVSVDSMTTTAEALNNNSSGSTTTTNNNSNDGITYSSRADDAVYSLDLRRAVLSKHSGWMLSGGGRLDVEETHYAHRALRNLLVCSITLTNTGSVAATVPVRERLSVLNSFSLRHSQYCVS